MISIKDVSFSYKRSKKLFADLNLQVPTGITGLLGRNGEGKTTILKLIIGSLTTKEGSISVMDKDPRARKVALLDQIFWLPEVATVPPMKVSRFLSLYGSFYPSYDHELANEAIKIFGIDLNWKLNKVSQGQQKKVIITLALAARTPLLLMDEPTNGLDIPSKAAFRQLMAKYTSENQAVIISTHQVRDLESLIDRIVMLDNNKIVCNKTIEFLSKRLSFGRVGEHPGEPLYTEMSPLGLLGVYDAREEGNFSENFSMELFFDGMIATPEKLQAITKE